MLQSKSLRLKHGAMLRLKRLARDPKLLRVRHCGGPVVQRSFAGAFDLFTINLRHIVSSVKLRSLEVVYPNTWNPTEFRAGVAHAFEQVNRVLGRLRRRIACKAMLGVRTLSGSALWTCRTSCSFGGNRHGTPVETWPLHEPDREKHNTLVERHQLLEDLDVAEDTHGRFAKRLAQNHDEKRSQKGKGTF